MTKKYHITKSVKKQIFVLPNVLTSEAQDDTPADFETAITATGFGKYNFFLILIGIPAGCACTFTTTTMSYVFPAAQCDLNLSLEDKGLLNAITYFGMISSALVWGFLFDTLGRKKLLAAGYIIDGVVVLLSSLSQSKALLMTAKYLDGFIINGPFAALTTYISEFHCAQHRARMQMVLGIIYNCGNLFLPLLAWGIIPQTFDWSFFNSSLTLHSWNIYLFICSLPSLISGLVFMFMPESPKFLMTTGQNEKALTVFQRVYSLNTGLSAENYPIKCLVDEIKLKEENPNLHGGHVTAKRTRMQALTEGWQQMKPLCFPPYVASLILICSIQTLIMMSLNTLRLWLPQIFQAMNDYVYYNKGESANLCTMLQMIQPSNSTSECAVNMDNSSVYINSMVVAAVTVASYLLAGYLINILGKKKLLCLMGTISGLCSISIYFTRTTAQTLVLSSIYTACGSICSNVVLTVIIDLFPTTSRTMTVSLAMMLGRSGATVGNIIFPMLLQSGCLPPFLTLGSIILGCALLSLFLPNTDMKALE